MGRNIYIVAGATATGKSSFSISLAKKTNSIVINADSRQVYKELPIVTAQPFIDNEYIKTETIINGINTPIYNIDEIDHLLYSYKSIEDVYNIFIYNNDINTIINSNEYKYRNIVLVGGSGLYLDSYAYRYSSIYDNNKNNKKENEINYEEMSIDELINKLGDRAKELNESDRKNKRRLISRLKNQNRERQTLSSEISKYILLLPPIEEIERNIKTRIEKMKDLGIEKEAYEVYSKYKDKIIPNLEIIGYKEFIPYFNNECTIKEVYENITVHTRQYAKRQITWFKRNNDALIHENISDISSILKDIL